MRALPALLIGSLIAASPVLAPAEDLNLSVPQTVEAGSSFAVQTTGSGKATLYIVGPGQVLRRDVQLGSSASITAADIYNAGHYTVVLSAGSSTQTGAFDLLPAATVGTVSFLAKPSRVSVGLHNGISGAVYVFDSFQNLILKPTEVTFQLSGSTAAVQERAVLTHDGFAATQMDSSSKESNARFVARAGDVSTTRVIQQVPGDPCGLRMTAHQSGQKIELETDPLRDCGGNAVPEGTIVTFTEAYKGAQTTVDVPVKRGVARAELPAYNGALISAATGIVLGNEIRWGK